MAEVTARRIGRAQMFRVTVEGDERVWQARQFGFRQRAKEPVMIPYWYEDGKNWHLYVQGKTDGPPVKSFTSMGELKAHVGELVRGAAG